MKSNYKRLGDYIQLVDERNKGLKVENLLGLSISKQFIPSVANTIGTDMENYKIIYKNQFACSTMQVRRDKKMPVALLKDYDKAIISQAYPVFEVKDTNELAPEYLMMWFSRSEFDRETCFHAVGGVRGSLEWEDFIDLKLPIPSIEKQREIVKEYNTIQNRITLNQQLIQKLESTAQAIYKEWFVDFEFPNEEGKPYKSSGGEMVWNEELGKEIPKGWENGKLEDCVTFINGYGFESEDLLDYEIEDCYSVFKMGNIKKGGGLNIEGTKSWIEIDKCKDLKRFVLRKGDLLMCMTDMKDNIGLLGNTALMNIDDKFIVNQRVGLLRTNNELGISYRHLYLVTNSLDFLQNLRSRANRGVQVNLTTNEILSTKLILADLQTNLRFDNILEAFFERINVAFNNICLNGELKRILLSKLAII